MSDSAAPPRSVFGPQAIPVDLAAVFILMVIANAAIVLPVINQSPLRAIFGLLFVLVVPGYALIAALFPEGAGRVTERPAEAAVEGKASEGDPGSESETNDDSHPAHRLSGIRRIDGFERLALSFASSLAIVPLFGLGLSLSPVGFSFGPFVVVLNAFILGCLVIALIRRRWRPPADRFHVPTHVWMTRLKGAVSGPDSRSQVFLNIGLAVAIIFAVSALGLALVVPPEGEQYTEFYTVMETEDGEYVAANYPEILPPDDAEPIHLGIENYEGESIEYTIVVQLQRVEGAGNESTVAEQAEIDRFSVTVDHGETTMEERALTGSNEVTGEQLRLEFLLFDGPPPDEPTRENAYRQVHLWVDVPENTE